MTIVGDFREAILIRIASKLVAFVSNVEKHTGVLRQKRALALKHVRARFPHGH